MLQVLKHWFYPHQHNNHHPKAIRHPALTGYVIALLVFHIGYTTIFAKSTNVLGFATAISQQEVIRLTNEQRAANGVGQLTENALLDRSAMAKAQNMFAEDYWAHYAPSGKSPWYWFDQAGYSYTLAGENLARDFDTSAGVINGWMNSPSHRANMLAPGYKDIGIAVLNGTLEGQQTTLVVQHFGTPVTLAPASVSSSSKPSVAGLTTQLAPVAVSTPAPVVDTPISQETVQPKTSGTPGIPSIDFSRVAALPYQLLHPSPLKTWGVEQTVTLIFLLCLMLMFIFDSTVLYRKGATRDHSHSFLHAGMLAVLIVLVMYSTIGGVL
jgi:uncharacterized protein YkwD